MQIVATSRNLQGTGASRRLRISGNTPGIVFGAGQEAQKIEINHNNLFHALKKEEFHTSILDLEVDGKSTKVVLRDVQFHPFRPLVLHVDFQRVDANTVLTMKVPVHFSGAEESPAVKVDKCMVTPVVTEIEVRCVAKDLPEFISVDLSKLEKGAPLHLNDVALPKGVKLVAQNNAALVSIAAPAAAEEEAPAAAAE